MTSQTLNRVLVALFVLFAVYVAIDGVREAWTFNDFAVYHWAGEMALDHSPQLYELSSPEENRPFLYSPGAAILLSPLGLMPHDAAAVMWSLARVLFLALLIGGSVRFSGACPHPRTDLLVAALLTLLIGFRSISNDVGNGQINIIVAGFAACGVWLMMTRRGVWACLGGVSLAVAITLKMTPLLFLAVPLLHRKWLGLIATVLATLLFLLVIPAAWYGWDTHATLFTEFQDETADGIRDGHGSKIQGGYHETIVFVTTQWSAEAEDFVFANGHLARASDPEQREVRLAPPFSAETGKKIWLGIGLLGGVVFLVTRQLLRRQHPVGWEWDFAMLAVFSLLLSPIVRKAHVVMVIIAAGWLMARVIAMVRHHGGVRAWWRAEKAIVATVTFAALMLLVGVSLEIPIPGFPAPLEPAVFLGLNATLVALVLVEKRWQVTGKHDTNRCVESG